MPEVFSTTQDIPTLKPPEEETPHHLKKRWFFVGLLIGIFLITFYFSQNNAVTQSVRNNDAEENEGGLLSPSPFPFREMTIPYLREREYTSKLDELVTVSENVSYTSFLTSYNSDGYKIHALLTKPVGDMPAGGWPGIVFIHGYIPPALYETNGEAYSSYVDYLARNGFVVLKIDLRGHGISEGEPGGGYYGSDYVVDALNAYAALESTDFVGKVGMWGHSMAGNILMRSFAIKPEIPAIVIWGGAVYSYTDMQKYGIQDTSYRPPMPTNNAQRLQRRRELFERHGSPSAQSNFWQLVAPSSFLKNLKGAVALHHAINDDVVNVGYSRDLVALMEEASVEHEFYEYESGGHNITGGSFTLAMDRTVAFFDKHLR